MITQEHLWAPDCCDRLHGLSCAFDVATLSTQKHAIFPNLCWMFHVRNTHTSPPNVWSAIFYKALVFITNGNMCLGFISSDGYFILLYIHLALHLAVTFSVRRPLGTFSCRFPKGLPVGCEAMAPLTATGALGSRSPSLSHIAPCQRFSGTWKKPFGPHDICFKQGDSRQVFECVFR